MAAALPSAAARPQVKWRGSGGRDNISTGVAASPPPALAVFSCCRSCKSISDDLPPSWAAADPPFH